MTRTAVGPALTAGPAVRPLVAGLCVAGQRQRDADSMLLHLADRLAGTGCPAEYLFTHLISGPSGGRVACSVGWPTVADPDEVWPALVAETGELGAALYVDDSRWSGAADLVATARAATVQVRARREGRAVVFPGSRDLSGELTVAQLLDRSAIDSVAVLANGVATGTDTVHTRGFVRPVLRDGRLDLLVQPAAGGIFVPFETPNPTPCCADHA